jgi:hypothetical protein
LQGWVAAGLPPDLFWRTTPAEMNAMQAGVVDRMRHDLRVQQGLCYTQAVLMGTAVNAPKNLPPFKKVFPDPVEKKAMTADAMLASMELWAKRFGATSPK